MTYVAIHEAEDGRAVEFGERPFPRGHAERHMSAARQLRRFGKLIGSRNVFKPADAGPQDVCIIAEQLLPKTQPS